LDGVMEAIDLGGEANAGRRLSVLRAIDKLDRLGRDGVIALLSSGRRDESGDFTKGAGLNEKQVNIILSVIIGGTQVWTPVGPYPPKTSDELSRNDDREYYRNSSQLDAWAGDLKDSSVGLEGIGELRQLAEFCEAAGYGSRRVRIDPSVVRGLEYYTGPVFEAELTFETPGEDGRPVRFGSVGGGGLYDGLVARFREEPVPATGFSIGISRLLAALRAIQSPIVKAAETPGPVVVLTLDRDPDSMANTQRLVASLRHAGIAAELYLGEGKMNAQLKYADKRRSRIAVIQGSNERNAPGGPQVTIRDLKLGAELAR